MTSIAISAGHGLYVRGASGILDEVDEARRVVSRLATELGDRGVDVEFYWDDVSTTQNENLNRLTDWHNQAFGGPHDLDISVHFNAYEQVSKPMGVEVLYVTQKKLAAAVSEAIADCGLIDRGAKYRDDLFILNNTEAPAILIEVCFVDSEADAEIYNTHFDLICESIANVLGGEETDITPEPEPPEALFYAKGKCSYFGGPEDTGVDSDEGLAFIYSTDMQPFLFLPEAPEDAPGLARRLNPFVHYVACRWDYSVTSKEALLQDVALVRATKTGLAFTAFPADWGPHEDTGRVADLSPSLMTDLGIETDDEVEVIYPAP
jgi:N-acetylmuramoyl-L-alanine amidase